ncbi:MULTISPECIES: F0F1 ATP synthase subunit gamma [Sutterella]|uniref:ATP synthase gamma chain n=4 Tax=Sutterella TaxID=40544 RepID=A0A6I1EMC5_9BURK|nr:MULTISPECIES: F0F1 ATP synthase subunit gamma [Sutterella]MBE5691298.1 F0F1 ATP synthase subunit gamma [Sutterella sp.]MBS5217744.1 F0F1 ATP synthase subunit gamma [Sutterella wadsworthensis]KAB7652608.1 F0F1 ATP synthase subunit gamma [Sutterella seckii]KAB7654976.1 F0F1 ATP synthase subunit gamma [Sutterella seckii]QDA54902.1 F0F1 ATP synthase subunit gamma [Sutterella faecalis]
MPSTKEIRGKIKSVQNTRKITKAMEMVAASKMRKAQDRMHAARPYGDKIRVICSHLARANVTDYRHPFLNQNEGAKKVGIILVSTDKGLAGALNTNIQRVLLQRMREWSAEGIQVEASALGNKGLGFLQRLGVPVLSQAVQLGDRPSIDRLIGAIAVQIEAYKEGKVDKVYLCYSRFVNAMKQIPVVEQLLPLSDEQLSAEEPQRKFSWDYIYEPDAQTVLDELLRRYVEALIYQAVAENMASEQSARMVAMKAASDNAKKLIDDLQLVYNKTRQAGITKEITEIVGGAAAVSS